MTRKFFHYRLFIEDTFCFEENSLAYEMKRESLVDIEEINLLMASFLLRKKDS